MATIKRRETGHWQAKVRRKGHKPITRTFVKKLDAERWAHAVEERMHVGVYQDGRSAERMTITALADWYREQVLTARTRGSTEHYLVRLIVARFGETTCAALASQDIAAWAKDLTGHYTGATVRHALGSLSRMLTSAMSFGVITLPANPVTLAKGMIRTLRTVPPSVKRARRLKPGEEAALLAVRTRSRILKPIIGFALETAMRRGEIVHMRREDVDRHARTLRIRHSKTDWKTGDAGRTIPLSQRALDILAALPVRLDGSIWGIKDEHAVTRAFERLCRTAGIADLRFHDLRHEATSRLFERGFSIEQVAVFTGHRDWQSLKRYTHPDPAKIAQRMR